VICNCILSIVVYIFPEQIKVEFQSSVTLKSSKKFEIESQARALSKVFASADDVIACYDCKCVSRMEIIAPDGSIEDYLVSATPHNFYFHFRRVPCTTSYLCVFSQSERRGLLTFSHFPHCRHFDSIFFLTIYLHCTHV